MAKYLNTWAAATSEWSYDMKEEKGLTLLKICKNFIKRVTEKNSVQLNDIAYDLNYLKLDSVFHEKRT